MEIIRHNQEIASPFQVKRLDPDNLKDLETLYRSVYSNHPGKDHFTAKYDTAYTGCSFIGYLAYTPEGTPIAFYGVIPCFLQYQDRRVLSAQSADTMTHPRYRNKGLFASLAPRCFALCKRSGIKIVFGFPNQHSLHGLIHTLGWITTENMERFTIPVSGIHAGSLFRRPGPLRDLYRCYTEGITRKHFLPTRGLANTMIDEGFGGVVRDDPYWQYRTWSPAFVIKAGQAKAWIRIGDSLVIGDLHATSQNFDEAIRILRKIAGRLGLPRLSFQSSPGTPLHALFAARYEAIASFPVCFKDLGSELPPDKIKFTFSDIDIF